jgi:hypothetical protein
VTRRDESGPSTAVLRRHRMAVRERQGLSIFNCGFAGVVSRIRPSFVETPPRNHGAASTAFPYRACSANQPADTVPYCRLKHDSRSTLAEAEPKPQAPNLALNT